MKLSLNFEVSDKCDFKTAQMLFIVADLENDNIFTSNVVKKQKYKKAKVGALAVEYRDDKKGTDLYSLYPTDVILMLSKCLAKKRKKAQVFCIG